MDLRRAAEIVYVEVPALVRRVLRSRWGRGGRHRPGGAVVDPLPRAHHPLPRRGARRGAGERPGCLPPFANARRICRISRSGGPGNLPGPGGGGPSGRAASRRGAGRRPARGGHLLRRGTLEGDGRELAPGGGRPTRAGGGARDHGAKRASHPELAAHRAEIPPVRGARRVTAAVRGGRPAVRLDEVTTLRSSEAYLTRRFGFRSVAVYTESEAAPHDPKGRRELPDRGCPRSIWSVGTRLRLGDARTGPDQRGRTPGSLREIQVHPRRGRVRRNALVLRGALSE